MILFLLNISGPHHLGSVDKRDDKDVSGELDSRERRILVHLLDLGDAQEREIGHRDLKLCFGSFLWSPAIVLSILS